MCLIPWKQCYFRSEQILLLPCHFHILSYNLNRFSKYEQCCIDHLWLLLSLWWIILVLLAMVLLQMPIQLKINYVNVHQFHTKNGSKIIAYGIMYLFLCTTASNEILKKFHTYKMKWHNFVHLNMDGEPISWYCHLSAYKKYHYICMLRK